MTCPIREFKSTQKCPSCGGAMEQVFRGGGNFILKGPGFYSTDTLEGRSRRAHEAGESV